ncbi:MAG: hypothetical protein LN412_06405 [Candidatus Thermoplasmatota archaeon]|nr:hypothetical protein [Candidatus Thermoplasmatota archaeon]
MTEYYFDIETEGEDPLQDRIVTIQFQQLENGKPLGNFSILAEWEWGEKEIIRSILEKGLMDVGWDFVPIGNRLSFDITFIVERAERHKLLSWELAQLKFYFFKKPMLDLWPILVLMNRGRFQGSSLTRFSQKKDSGGIVPALYKKGEYEEILRYIEEEREAVLDLYHEVGSVLSALGDRRQARLSEG